MKWFYRRWHVQKYNPRTGQAIPTDSPESERLFWTEGGAIAEECRLNAWLMTTHLPHRFRTVRVYRKRSGNPEYSIRWGGARR